MDFDGGDVSNYGLDPILEYPWFSLEHNTLSELLQVESMLLDEPFHPLPPPPPLPEDIYLQLDVTKELTPVKAQVVADEANPIYPVRERRYDQNLDFCSSLSKPCSFGAKVAFATEESSLSLAGQNQLFVYDSDSMTDSIFPEIRGAVTALSFVNSHKLVFATAGGEISLLDTREDDEGEYETFPVFHTNHVRDLLVTTDKVWILGCLSNFLPSFFCL
jgi:hypothetical protein